MKKSENNGIQQYNKIVQEQVDFSTNFVMKNPFSMASILALYQKLRPQNYVIKDLHTMRVAASALNSIYPESEHVKALYRKYCSVSERGKKCKIAKVIQENGQKTAPKLFYQILMEKKLLFHRYEGKWCLLQFWSAVDQEFTNLK